MDIWDWIRQTERDLRDGGHARLARLIDVIPTYACDDAHDQLDAVMPEALALARDLDHGHLEVFLRHWNLQSRILHRMEARAYLPEAVSLLDFAHQPENVSCPQSVCVTQDLAIAYKQRDRVGYVAERLAVSEETLERIDASWSCFECIGLEQVSAMIDGGDPAGALARLDALCGLIEKVTTGPYLAHRLHRMDAQRVTALERLGRLDEAAALALERVAFKERSRHEDRHAIHSARLEAARVLALSGRGEEAMEVLPEPDALMDTPSHYKDLSDALVALEGLGLVENDWRLGARLGEMARRLGEQGVSREAVEIAWEHARLAIERGAGIIARRALALVAVTLLELRARHDLIADALPEVLERARALEASVEVPQTDEELDARIGEDPERDLDVLIATFAARPESDLAFHALASAYDALGFQDELLAHLRAGFADAPDGSRLMRLAGALSEAEGPAGVRAFTAGLVDGPWGALAYFARALYGGMAARDRIEGLEAAIEGEPGLSAARLLLAAAYREQGQWAEALGALESQLEVFGPDQPDVHWDRMTAATVLGRWDAVRDSARAIGFPLEEGEGPIEQEFGYCKLDLEPLRDGSEEVWAMRTGPTSARVVSLSRVGTPQHMGDVYAFDAQPLNPLDGPLAEGEHHAFVYPVAARVTEGGYGPTYSLDGPRPTAEQLAELTRALEERGALVSVRSSEAYTVHDARDDEEVPAVYIVFAFEGEADPSEVDATLTALAGQWARPMAWPALAAAGGGEAAAARHAALCERFGLSGD
jgi:tetratricopeptide (TPR) repeat protein